jgi:hypothetical protein
MMQRLTAPPEHLGHLFRQRKLVEPERVESEPEPWLEKALHRVRGDEVALGRLLIDELPSWQRVQARLLLIRELGAREAAAVCERWFGIGRVRIPGDGSSQAWELLEPPRARATAEAVAATAPGRVAPPVDVAWTSRHFQPAIERRAAMIYRRALDSGDVDVAHPALLSALARQSAGQPLPADLERRFAARLGADLSKVRVHTDTLAAEAALAVRARAFTLGEDVFFGAGAWAPASREGQALLAHELQHVLQWQRGQGGDPAALEREAVAVEVATQEAPFDEAASGTPVEVPHRAQMERFYGADFGGVRAHLGRPAEMASLGARAATRGEEIVFAEADPAAGLVAHELAHVVQQRNAGARDVTSGVVSQPSDTAEREAHAAAESFVEGAAPPSLSALSGEATIHRESGAAQTAADVVSAYAPALAKLLAGLLPEQTQEQLLETATGFLAKLPVIKGIAGWLTPPVLNAFAVAAAKIYRTYQRDKQNMSVADIAKEAAHDSVPDALLAVASAALPATLFATALPGVIAGAIPTAIAYGLYLGARKALPQRGSIPQKGDKLPICGGFFDLNISEAVRPWFGYFGVTAELQKGESLKLDWLEIEKGVVKMTMVDRTKIVGIYDVSGVEIKIGGFVLSDLKVTSDVRFGLEVTSGTVKDPWGAGSWQLSHLSVSSGGWLTGKASVRGDLGHDMNGDYTVRFGATYPEGVEFDLDVFFFVDGDDFSGDLRGVRPTTLMPMEFPRHKVNLMVGSFDRQRLELDSCFITLQKDRLILDGKGERYAGGKYEKVNWTATREKDKWSFDIKPVEGKQDKPDAAKTPEEEHQAEPEAPRIQRLGGKSLISTLHDVFTGNLGTYTSYFLHGAHGAVWALSYFKGASADSVSTDAEEKPKQAQGGGWMSYLDPRQYGLVSALNGLKLPDFGSGLPEMPKLAFSNLRFSAEDVGGKFMLRGGGTLTVTMPKVHNGDEMKPGPSGSGDLELRWFPFDPPYIVLLAQVNSDVLTLKGIEADPTDGVRIAKGVLKLPLPSAVAEDGTFEATADFLQIGHGFHFRRLSGSLKGLQFPRKPQGNDIYLKLNEVTIAALAGAGSPRFEFKADGDLHNVIGSGQDYLKATAKVAWGGGKPFALEAGASLNNFEIGDWLTATSAGAKVEYGKDGFAGEISTKGLHIKPIKAFDFGVEAATLRISREGLAGTSLKNLRATWGGSGIQLGALEIYEGRRFKATGVSVIAALDDLRKLPFFNDLGWDKTPSWLQAFKVRAGIDIIGTGDGVEFKNPKFGVVAAGLSLFGVGGGFDLEKGTASIRLYKSGTFRPTAQIPVHPGVGVEIGGLIRYRVGLDGSAKVNGGGAEDPEKPITIDGKITLKGGLQGSLVAGAFGGIPGLFTVGGGLHAGLTLDPIVAEAGIKGSLHLPSKTHPHGSGHLGFNFAIKGEGNKPATANVEAGPYIFVDFAGLSKTLRLNLIKVPLLQMEAYGGLLLDAPPQGTVDGEGGKHVRTIPDPFPVYRVQVHEALKEAFASGKNALLGHRIKQAERNLALGFAKVSAAEQRIGDEKKIAASQLVEGDVTAKDKKELSAAEKHEETTRAGQDESKVQIQTAEEQITKLNKLQDYLRHKKRRYQWQLQNTDETKKKPTLLAKAKNYGLEVPKEVLFFLSELELGAALAALRSSSKGRAPSKNASAQERLELEHKGSAEKRDLTPEDLKLKIEQKQQEIDYVLEGIEAIGSKLAKMETESEGSHTTHEEAEYRLVKAQTVVDLHKVPLKEEYDAEKQEEHARHGQVLDELSAQRGENLGHLASGKKVGKAVVGILTGAAKEVKEHATHAKAQAARAVTPEERKSLEHYKKHEQKKLREAWEKANHVYRVVARRRAYEEAHIEKRKLELKAIDAQITALEERQAQLEPEAEQTQTGVVKQQPQKAAVEKPAVVPQPQPKPSDADEFPDVPDGPAFDIRFELLFWNRRKEQVELDIQRLEERKKEGVEMADPMQRLSTEQTGMLRNLSELPEDQSIQKEKEAELQRKQDDVAEANQGLDAAREKMANASNRLDEINDLLKALGEMKDEASGKRRQVLQQERIAVEKKLKLAEVKEQQKKILADAAAEALAITLASQQRSVIE